MEAAESGAWASSPSVKDDSTPAAPKLSAPFAPVAAVDRDPSVDKAPSVAQTDTKTAPEPASKSASSVPKSGQDNEGETKEQFGEAGAPVLGAAVLPNDPDNHRVTDATDKVETNQADDGPELVNVEEPQLDDGLVQRRAPKNPLASPALGKFRVGGGKKKVKDPRLLNNPVRGRLVVLIGTSCALIAVFMQELVYNYLSFNGRCISQVANYSDMEGTVLTKPIYVAATISYMPCERGTQQLAKDRGAVGSNASDYGIPSFVRGAPTTSTKKGAAWDSPNSRILRQLGGLDTNLIRNFDESFRLFWSMWMHGGFMHIIVNLACQIQILWMVEPDWGLVRTLFVYFVSGVTGNLITGVLDPCSVTVGSSGCLYGLLACLIPYCIEFWKTIPRPCTVLVFMVVVLIIGIISGFTGYTDNYAHMGGALGGLLSSFATTTTLTAFDDATLAERMARTPPFKFCIPQSTREALAKKVAEEKAHNQPKKPEKKKATGAKGKAIRTVKDATHGTGKPECRMNKREWIVRLISLALLITVWVVMFLYLYSPSLYHGLDPAGQYKFEGRMECNCCFIGGDKFPDFKVGAVGLFHCFGSARDKAPMTEYCAP